MQYYICKFSKITGNSLVSLWTSGYNTPPLGGPALRHTVLEQQ